jgi:conjugal transfer pilus assembly protein TraB
MEKYKAENSSELTELKIQIKQLNQQISDMQNGKDLRAIVVLITA